MWLSQPELADLKTAAAKFGLNYQWCREQSRIYRVLAYRVTPKVHRIQHLPEFAGLINPRCLTNYAEEGTVGSVTRIFKMSKFGRYEENVQKVVLAKRLLGLLLRMEGYDD